MSAKKRVGALGAILVASLTSCADPKLMPAEPPGAATTASAAPQEAQAQEAGVRVVITTNAWDGRPEALGTVLTPVRVQVENRGDRAVAIRYSAFRLTSPSGRTYAAIPPYDIEEDMARPVASPYYRSAGFGVAPYLGGFYPGYGPYGGSFGFDAPYYGTYYPYWQGYRDIDLPTEDMIERALPEGVLEPGGQVAGYLYFENVEEEGSATFRVLLVGPDGAEPYGEISIPLVAADV